MIEARILRSGMRVFDCELTSSKTQVKATALREALKQEGHIVVGDLVRLEQDMQSGSFEIVEVLPRKNKITRNLIREKKIKVLASNIDLLVIVSSVSKPLYKKGLIDRYIIRSREWDIPCIVVFNKFDEFDNQFDLEFEEKKYHSLGIQTFRVSSEDINAYDFKNLKSLLKNKTSIFLGQSGVGKSRLITSLSSGKVSLLSRELAKKVDKGSHTTTWSELINLEDFSLIDSPGVRSMGLSDISKEELIHFFPELHPYVEACQFTNCTHEPNSKGCGFRNCSNEIILDRLNSYKSILEDP